LNGFPSWDIPLLGYSTSVIRQDLISGRVGCDHFSQGFTHDAKRQDGGSEHQAGNRGRSSMMRASHQDQPVNFVLASIFLYVIAAHQSSQAVTDQLDRGGRAAVRLEPVLGRFCP